MPNTEVSMTRTKLALNINNNFLLQINLIAPPLYVVITQTLERTDGIAALNKAIDAIKDSIEDAGGMFNTQLKVKLNIRYNKFEVFNVCCDPKSVLMTDAVVALAHF